MKKKTHTHADQANEFLLVSMSLSSVLIVAIFYFIVRFISKQNNFSLFQKSLLFMIASHLSGGFVLFPCVCVIFFVRLVRGKPMNGTDLKLTSKLLYRPFCLKTVCIIYEVYEKSLWCSFSCSLFLFFPGALMNLMEKG